MAYDITGMANYAKSNGEVLITDLVLGGESFSMAGINIQKGIKSTDKLVDITEGDTYLQTTLGDPGALSYSGGTTLADIDITVIEMAIKERYVKAQLEGKIAQMTMKAGSDPSNPLPYENVLVDLKSKSVGRKNDILLWQGTTATGNTNPNTNKFDGWLTLALAGSSVSGGSAAELASSTVLATMEAFHNVSVENFPVWVDGSFIYMSPKSFSTYYRAIYGLGGVQDGNSINQVLPSSFLMPGTNTLVSSAQGLIGKTNIIETREYNFTIGTDLETEGADYLNFEYLNEALIWRLMGVYKLGAQVSRVAEVVMTK